MKFIRLLLNCLKLLSPPPARRNPLKRFDRLSSSIVDAHLEPRLLLTAGSVDCEVSGAADLFESERNIGLVESVSDQTNETSGVAVGTAIAVQPLDVTPDLNVTDADIPAGGGLLVPAWPMDEAFLSPDFWLEKFGAEGAASTDADDLSRKNPEISLEWPFVGNNSALGLAGTEFPESDLVLRVQDDQFGGLKFLSLGNSSPENRQNVVSDDQLKPSALHPSDVGSDVVEVATGTSAATIVTPPALSLLDSLAFSRRFAGRATDADARIAEDFSLDSRILSWWLLKVSTFPSLSGSASDLSGILGAVLRGRSHRKTGGHFAALDFSAAAWSLLPASVHAKDFQTKLMVLFSPEVMALPGSSAAGGLDLLATRDEVHDSSQRHYLRNGAELDGCFVDATTTAEQQELNQRSGRLTAQLGKSGLAEYRAIVLSDAPPEPPECFGIWHRQRFDSNPRGPPVSDSISATEHARLFAGSQQLKLLRYCIAPRGPSVTSTL